MIINNGEKWVAPKYKITQPLVIYDDNIDSYEGATIEENILSEEQKARLMEIEFTQMSEDEAIAYVRDGVGIVPDTRDGVDKLIDALIELAPDGETMGTILETAKEWRPGETCDRYTYLQHEGVLYKTIHPIRPHDTLSPPEAPHLYTRVGAIDGGGITVEEWRQPTGEHDAYKIGDKVLHNGQTWVCTLGDASGLNSWEPGVYGWEVA